MFRYFKVNIINGCRLSDINKNVSQDEVFYINSHIATNSRSVSAAIKAKWILEITEKEAAQHIQLPTREAIQLAPREEVIDPIGQKTSSFNDRENEGAIKRVQARLQKLEEETKPPTVRPADENTITYSNDTEKRVRQRMDRVKKMNAQKDIYEKDVKKEETDSALVRQEMARKYLENKNNARKEDLLVRSAAKIEEMQKVKEQVKSEIDAQLAEKIKKIESNKVEVVEDTVPTGETSMEKYSELVAEDVAVVEKAVEKVMKENASSKTVKSDEKKPVKKTKPKSEVTATKKSRTKKETTTKQTKRSSKKKAKVSE